MKNILMKSVLFTLVVVFSASGICSAQTTLYFPQFVDGTQDRNSVVWATVIAVTNPAAAGTPAASGTITLTKDNGAPMNIGLTDPISGAVGGTFLLAGAQTKFFFSPTTGSVGPQPLNSGFATVTSNLPVTAALIFIEYGPYLTFPQSGEVVSQAGVAVATPLTRQAGPLVKFPNTDGGVAIANPGTGTATITFQPFDTTGAAFGSPVTRTLAANNHTAFFVSQLFPNLPAIFLGTLRIISDNPVAATALGFQGNLITTIPIFPLP